MSLNVGDYLQVKKLEVKDSKKNKDSHPHHEKESPVSIKTPPSLSTTSRSSSADNYKQQMPSGAIYDERSEDESNNYSMLYRRPYVSIKYLDNVNNNNNSGSTEQLNNLSPDAGSDRIYYDKNYITLNNFFANWNFRAAENRNNNAGEFDVNDLQASTYFPVTMQARDNVKEFSQFTQPSMTSLARRGRRQKSSNHDNQHFQEYCGKQKRQGLTIQGEGYNHDTKVNSELMKPMAHILKRECDVPEYGQYTISTITTVISLDFRSKF